MRRLLVEAAEQLARGWRDHRGAPAVANPDHRRSPLLQLTAPGRAQLQALTEDPAADRAARLTAAGLTAGQLDGARQVVRALIGALDG